MAGFNPQKFVQEVKTEAARVTWPNRKETQTTTLMVFVMVILASVFLFVADAVMNAIVRTLLGMGA
ncbi:MAG: preprotein translocase subunit SecE [Alphaproteobacteria bacterium GWF2_58_20]|nr:MAG: preprotein translocase subunit SecE [Alphaproteobacteria bacterium GWF2_58_20]